jgi:uncharacterized protein (DUF924 family)
MEYSADEILNFWFGETARDHWFKKSEEFDLYIVEHYINLVEYLSNEVDQNGVSPWEGEPEGDLASIIVLDQFPRNMFRDTERAFSYDDKALGVTRRCIDRKNDRAIIESQRAFVYMPLMHAEDLEMQERSVLVFNARLEDKSNWRFAVEHRDIIRRFGRFPHRNETLGRQSTNEEIEFLQGGGFSG